MFLVGPIMVSWNTAINRSYGLSESCKTDPLLPTVNFILRINIPFDL